MPDIYDEVLSERKRLLEVAESNAKSRIIDAITPRIKEMVEASLLGELDEFGDGMSSMMGDDVGPDALDPSIEDDALDGMHVDPMMDAAPSAPETDVAAGEDAGLTLPDADGKVTLDVDSFMGTGKPEMAASVSSFELTPESIMALESLVVGDLDVAKAHKRILTLESRVRGLASIADPSAADLERARQVRVECEGLYAGIMRMPKPSKKLTEQLQRVYDTVMENYSALGHMRAIARRTIKINEAAGAIKHRLGESRHTTGADRQRLIGMLHEVKDLNSIVGKIFGSRSTDDSIDRPAIKRVGDNLAALYMEMRKMVTKNKQINEADELDVGAGAAPDAGGADMDLGGDMGGDDMAGGNSFDVLLKGLPADLSSVTGDEQFSIEVTPSADDGMGGDDALAGLDDMGDGMGDEPPMDDMDAGMGDEDEEDPMGESRLRDSDIIEIDEGALVAEMKRMKKLREKKNNVNTGGPGPAHFDNFGGGKGEKEPFVDSNDGDDDMHGGGDLNVLGEGELEEGDLEEADADSDEKVEEAARRRRRANENRNASKGAQLVEANVKLRTELAGQKLFNTKLVALNRVLQIPGLKKGQKEKVVELLDRGRTVAEVKTMYSRIVETLKKGGEGSRRIQESAQPQGGSASRASTSAAPSNDGDTHPLLEKWNRIAFGGSNLLKG